MDPVPTTMGLPLIRPRSAMEIVEAAVSLYRDNFSTMALIGVAASAPFVATIILGLGSYGAMRNMSAIISHPDALVPRMLGPGLILLLWVAVMDGAMILAASEAYHGRAITPAQAIRGALDKGYALIFGNLLRTIVVFGLAMLASAAFSTLGADADFVMMAVVSVGVFAAVIHLLARTFAVTSAIVLENRTAAEGLRRSFVLSGGATMRIIGIGLLCLIVYWIMQAIGAVTVQGFVRFALGSRIIAAIVGNVAGMIMYPFLNTTMMVLYYDQRVRKEGYDLDSGLVAPALG